MRRIVLLLASMALAVLLVAGVAVVGPVERTQAAFPGENGKIAYDEPHRASPDNYEIYVVNPDGSGLTNLTNASGSYEDSPAWSANGTQIVFVGTPQDKPSDVCYSFEIYTMKADGTSRTRLTNDTACDYSPHWSPDGTKIVYASNPDPRAPPGSNNWDIYVMNADGSSRVNITNNAAVDGAPVWSPDGTKIAFVSNRANNNFDLYTMNPDGSGLTRLTSEPGEEGHPDWSPDGTRLAFMGMGDRDPTTTSSHEIYTINANGSGQTRLTNNTLGDFEPVWSPDGTKIAFRSMRDGEYNSEIYTMDADGSNQTRFTNAPQEDERGLSWQPLPVGPPQEPTSKEQCKNGGYKDFGFKNQGQCIKAVNATN